MWKNYVTDVQHPFDRKKRAIVVCNMWKNQPYLALVTKIETNKVDGIPMGGTKQDMVNVIGFSKRRIDSVLEMAKNIIKRTSLQPWPACIKCRSFLSLCDEIKVKCRECGYENNWENYWQAIFMAGNDKPYWLTC